MKKTLLVLCTLVSLFTEVSAQVTKIEMSEPFEMATPETATKLIQTSDGSTIKISYSPKEGFSTVVYNGLRKQIAQENLILTYWNKKDALFTEICGIFEINNEVNIFISELFLERPHFIRLSIDVHTGKLKEEKLLASFGKRTEENFPYKKIFYIANLVNYKRPIFNVKKSISSDDYAVVICDKLLSVSLEGLTAFPGKKTEVIYYDKNHKEINRALFDVSPFNHQYMDLADIFVSNEQVFLVSYTYDKERKPHDSLSIILSKLVREKNQFEHRTVPIFEELRKADIQLLYNDKYKLLEMFSLTFIERDFQRGPSIGNTKVTKTYLPMLRTIDPMSITVLFSKPISTNNKLEDYYKQVLNNKEKYDGLPSRIEINQDGSTSILFGIQGDLAVLKVNEALVEQDAHILGGIKSPFNNSFPINHFSNDDHPAIYINTASNNNYIIKNEYIKNPKRRSDEKFIPHILCFQLAADGSITQTTLLDNQINESSCVSHYMYTNTGHFQLSTSVYAVLKTCNVDKKKQAQIAWVTFE